MRFGNRLAKEEIGRRRFERRGKTSNKVEKIFFFCLLAEIDNKAHNQLYC